jgi:hypothetical protein
MTKVNQVPVGSCVSRLGNRRREIAGSSIFSQNLKRPVDEAAAVRQPPPLQRQNAMTGMAVVMPGGQKQPGEPGEYFSYTVGSSETPPPPVLYTAMRRRRP